MEVHSIRRSPRPRPAASEAAEERSLPRVKGMVVVANRLPLQRVGRGEGARWEVSPGGLVGALQPIMRGGRGAWVGWTGTAGAAGRPFTYDGLRIRPVPLSAHEVETFYHGMANSTFWPLYHDAIRTPDFRREWWWPYMDVNRKYARAAAAVARPGDLVWVHDYHLQLVPRLLRELRPDVRIGFFLHIPFPPEELFAWLPWRRQVLEGLLGADVVGFQTYQNAQNFSRAARALTTAEGTDTELGFEGRTVRVNAFPISIDTGWFEATARDADVIARAREIRQRVGGRKIVLGVDRLDYTKGMDVRLNAFGEVLKRGKVTVDDCVFIQIAVPSRERVPEYATMRGRVEQMVGRINGEYSEPGRVAVHYFRRSVSREELVAYYRAADVMLVTPLRDGMNLVAKEFVATRLEGTGVLILSEFTGAARELRRALLVNPRDIDAVASALEAGLSLPKEEARHRMNILRTVVRRHDVFEWAGMFVEAMRR
jgi:alpha,alpha-trehalose-phosphate synthase [UDP-forming]